MEFSLSYSIANELKTVEEVFSNLEWFENNGYKILLPAGINTNSMLPELKTSVEQEFENNAVIAEKLKTEVNEFLKMHKETIDIFFTGFNYPVPQKIKVSFTAYGPGGMYVLPDSVVVMLKDSPQEIIQTILHEGIHLVIEEPFVKKYKLSHWEKEAVVDTLCLSDELSEIFSGYSRQPKTREIKSDLLTMLDYKKMSS